MIHSRTTTMKLLTWQLGLALVATLTSSAPAATELQGYYETNFTGGRSDETWQLYQPRHFFELRVLAAPWVGTEAFFKTNANSNSFRLEDDVNVHAPRFFFAEGHAKIRGAKTEVLFTTKQNRFWFSQPLLQVIDGNKRGGSRAVRVDFWDTFGFQGLAYYGDQTTAASEDFFVTRVTRPVAGRDLQFGTTFGRFDDGVDASSFEMTAAADVEVALGKFIPPLSRLGRTTLVVEAGRNLSGGLDDEDGLNAIEAELRDIRIADVTMKFNGWYREENSFTQNLSSRAFSDDRRGAFGEFYYRLPRKQLDVRYTYLVESSIVEDLFGDGSERFAYDEHRVELYGELKGGFSAWVKYRWDERNDRPEFQERQDLIFEIQGQNKLISVRPQIRFRNVDLPFAVEGYGMEVNFNATDTWKIFSRFLNADENAESRNTVYVQARYSGFQDAELFLEYGFGGRSDRLTENDGFVREGPRGTEQNDERQVQLILKYWF